MREYLLIHTCGAEGMVALAEEDRVLIEEKMPGRGTSEHLMPAIGRVLASRGRSVRDLAGVGVVHGPGSFTGVRVGLAAAKGLCEAGGIGMMAISRLELVAGDGVGVLDAGRGEFFAGFYRSGLRVWEKMLTRQEVEAQLAGGTAKTAEPCVIEALGGRVSLIPEPGPVEMLRVMLAREHRGEWSDVATIDANYLRRPDAEIALAGR